MSLNACVQDPDPGSTEKLFLRCARLPSCTVILLARLLVLAQSSHTSRSGLAFQEPGSRLSAICQNIFCTGFATCANGVSNSFLCACLALVEDMSHVPQAQAHTQNFIRRYLEHGTQRYRNES